MPQHKRGPWSNNEDAQLVYLVNTHGASNWVRISQTIGTRSPKQCRERYHQNLKPNLNHDPITPEEGALIEQLVQEMGKRWAEIARRLHGRSDNAVKNWWNGGQNRRRRSNNQRRQELVVRHPVQGMQPIPQQPLPHGFQQHTHMHHMPQMPSQFYGQLMYGPPQPHFAQPPSLPSNAPALRQPALVDAPLPSPSAFSQMSADGAPSLVSDSSARSPNSNGSPLELPPLSGARDDRRQSAAPMLRLSAPGDFATEMNSQYPMAPMHRFEDHKQQPQGPQMLQQPFLPSQPQQYVDQRGQQQFYQSAVRQPSPLQHYQVQQQYSNTPVFAQQQRPQHFETHQQQPQLSSPASLQLPGISGFPTPSTFDMGRRGTAASIDPFLMHSQGTPLTSAHTPEGSPKDKMSLSNITL